jgi:hypothetical protein
VFDRLNLKNPNSALPLQIAQRSLSSICRAVGVNEPPRTASDLRDKPLMVKLAVKPADGQYSASNEIKGYEAAKGGAAMQAAATASAGTATPPWKR